MFRMILIPLILAAVFVMLNCFSWRKPAKKTKVSEKQPSLFLPFAAAGAEIALFLLYWLVQHFLMAGDDFQLSYPVLFVICGTADAAVFFRMWFREKAICPLLRTLAVLALVLFIAEVGLFNAKSFTASYREEAVSFDRFTIEQESVMTYADTDHIQIAENAAVELHDPPDWCRAIRIQVSQGSKNRPFFIRALIEDDNFRDLFCIAGSKLTTGYGRDIDYSLKAFGSLRAIRLEFADMDVPVHFYGITCSSHIPFHFNTLRFIGLFCIIGLILTVRCLRLHEIIYDPKRKSHAAALYLVTAACTLSAFFLWIPDQEPMKYPEEFKAEKANPYEQMLDAFESGHLWINVDLDSQIADLGDRLYDRSVRDALDIEYAWDRAYYNGKLYSYFGVAPVLTFYYPFYWLTGTLPTQFHVNFFFSILSIPFLCLVLLELVKRYCKRVNLLLLLLMLPTAVLLSGACYFMQYPSQYNEAVAAGLCYLMISLWLGFRALELHRKWLRLLAFAGCGIFCVLSAGSRPSIVLGELLLTPAFMEVLTDKQMKPAYRFGQAAAFLVPVIAGAVGIMTYNAMRFSSPFDFGESYQLTVSNIQANKLYLSSLPASFYHYFLQPGVKKNVFPFFTYSVYNLENYGMFKYYENMFGILNYPLLLMGCLLLPPYLRKKLPAGGTASGTEAKTIVLLCVFFSVLLSWMEFCRGGASIRYQMDMIHLMVFASAIVILSLVHSPKRYLYPFTVGVIAVTLAVKFLMMIHITTEGHTVTTLITVHPMLQELLEDACIFWD